MVKPLRLLSIVVPSLAKTTDSQVMLQVANLKRGAAVENLHNGVQTMQTRMESMLEQAVTSGDTPELSQEAYDTMITALNEIEAQLDVEKTTNDGDWKTANDAILTCNTETTDLFNKGDEAVNVLKNDAAQSEKAHKTCRAQEDEKNKDEKKKHKKMTDTADESFADKPDCVKPDATPAELHTALQEAEAWGKAWEDKVDKANNGYTTAKGLSDKKEKECDNKQTAFETDFCQYDVALTTTCGIHEKCIKDAKAARTKKRDELTAKEAAEKLILKSCSKVRCYIQLLKNGKSITQDGYDNCRNKEGTFDDQTQTWSSSGPDKLNINWLPDNVADDCDTSPTDVAPGDSDWDGQRYTGLTKKSKAWMDRLGLEPTKTCKHHRKSD